MTDRDNEAADIQYLVGDAIYPSTRVGEHITIAHICNDSGAWGAGFVVRLGQRWPRARTAYRAWSFGLDATGTELSGKFDLGTVQLVPVEPAITIANMVAQHGLRGQGNPTPIRYDALDACLGVVARYALARRSTVVMPRIGTGLAGGKWETIESIIRFRLAGVPVRVYTRAEQ